MISINLYAFVAIVELGVMFAVISFFYYLRYSRIQARLVEQPADLVEDSEETSSKDLISGHIQQLIEKTQLKIDSLDSGPELEGDDLHKYRLKLAFLEAVHTALPHDNEEDYWQTFLQGIPAELLTQPQANDLQQEIVSREEHQLILEKLELEEQKVKNLEKYKQLFLDVNAKLNDIDNANADLIDHLEKNLPNVENNEEMLELINTLKQDKAELNKQIHFIEDEFENLMKNIAPDDSTNPSGATMDLALGLDDRVKSVTRMVTKQKLEIEELNNIIEELQVEVEDKKPLRKKLEELQKIHAEMGGVVEVLEDENEFLRKQIEVLLEMDNEKPASSAELDELKNRVNEKESELVRAEEKYLQLEAQYLEVVENKMQAS